MLNIETIKLRRGAGSGNPKDGFCLMQAVHWFSGARSSIGLSRHARPLFSALASASALTMLRPAKSARDQLWPLVWQLLDSRHPAAEIQRGVNMSCAKSRIASWLQFLTALLQIMPPHYGLANWYALNRNGGGGGGGDGGEGGGLGGVGGGEGGGGGGEGGGGGGGDGEGGGLGGVGGGLGGGKGGGGGR